ncbi:MAG: carboxyl-terminal protease, partial [Chloroflexi bacterium]|nr:carboxyl-terminal protease [Chloroflexota bacterium]
ESAVETASQFIPSGTILYQMQGNGEEQEFPALSGGLATQSPLVVLVNAGTASAAEIVAGALQDHNRAQLIGEATFGKGTVQNIHELSDGSSIHVTFAYWLTPDRHQIEGQGLTPDVEVTRTSPDEPDPQLIQALLLLRQEIIALPYSQLPEAA